MDDPSGSRQVSGSSEPRLGVPRATRTRELNHITVPVRRLVLRNPRAVLVVASDIPQVSTLHHPNPPCYQRPLHHQHGPERLCVSITLSCEFFLLLLVVAPPRSSTHAGTTASSAARPQSRQTRQYTHADDCWFPSHSPVYEYPLNNQWIMMDVDDGFGMSRFSDLPFPPLLGGASLPGAQPYLPPFLPLVCREKKTHQKLVLC